MENGYFVIAGKTEGFLYSDAKVLGCAKVADTEVLIASLRGEGYTIFYVTKMHVRIDDNLTKEAE
ncbi:hypothetical protein CSE15_16410 [Bacillus altitudinis]|uniref:hypothetical protein n=1 Tax=Bacillus altitudinis TaxID=293387 RepID=UPI000C15E61A|nr:hypothetical protein [Bacillus altitudinis]ATP95429.1 hypothetical protein CSE15_16410 [Bacillus altitudinis]